MFVFQKKSAAVKTTQNRKSVSADIFRCFNDNELLLMNNWNQKKEQYDTFSNVVVINSFVYNQCVLYDGMQT